MPFVDFLDDASIMRDIVLSRPDRLAAYLALNEDIMRGESPLTAGERELIGAYVSALNDCSFCFGAHAATAAQFGIDRALFESLLDDVDASPVAGKLKPILHFVKKLTENPSRMVQADADAVYAAGWDSRALSDAILVCGLFCMANRMVDGHGLNRATPNSVFETIADRLSGAGYTD
jgi:uncharacterized peroxidase-related enzyme